MRAARLHLFLSALLLALGCPEGDDDDVGDDDAGDDDAGDDDFAGDDDAMYTYSGTATSFTTGDPVEGIAVEVGPVQSETDAEGFYQVDLPAPPPQPITVVESDVEASTHIDCDTENDITVFDTEWDSFPDVQIGLHIHGLIDPTGFDGEWRSRAEHPAGGSMSSIYHLDDSDLVAVGEDEYTIDLTVRCMETWAAIATEHQGGGLVALGVESGDFLDCDPMVVDVFPDGSSLGTVTWDGVLEESPAMVDFYQFVPVGENSLAVTLWVGTATGSPVDIPLVVPDEDDLYVGTSIEREHPDCDMAYASQGFSAVQPGDTLSIEPLLEPIAMMPAGGGESYGFRPDVEFPGLPENVDYYSGSIWAYTYDPSFETALDWYFFGYSGCPISSLDYPQGLSDVTPGATGSVGFYYSVGDQMAGCYRFVEWQLL